MRDQTKEKIVRNCCDRSRGLMPSFRISIFPLHPILSVLQTSCRFLQTSLSTEPSRLNLRTQTENSGKKAKGYELLLILEMGKKHQSKLSSDESETPPILEINFSDPLFSVAAHPTRPILVSGLGTGHVYCHTYNSELLEDKLSKNRDNFLRKDKAQLPRVSQLKNKWWLSEADHAAITNNDLLAVGWKTKRHKGSCRSVIFDILESNVGESLFTVGTDNVLKKAKSETGKVHSKMDISSFLDSDSKESITTLAMSSSHPILLSGTDNGSILAFDSNDLSVGKLKYKIDQVHEDAINKILPMPAISAYHFLALGSTKLAHIDIRKGIVSQSDDQEDELLSMCYPTEFVNANKNDTVIVSHGDGVITRWKNSTNGLQDQLSRVKVNKNASIDAIISTMSSHDERSVDSLWCGDSEGLLHRVDYKKGKIIESRVHSSLMSKSGAVDEVGGLDIDYEYKLVSSGMEGLKIWSGHEFESLGGVEDTYGSEDETSSSNLDDSDSDSDLDSKSSNFESDDDDDEKISAIRGFSRSNADSGPGEQIREFDPVTKKRREVDLQALPQASERLESDVSHQDSIKSTTSKNHKRKKTSASATSRNNGIGKFDGL